MDKGRLRIRGVSGVQNFFDYWRNFTFLQDKPFRVSPNWMLVIEPGTKKTLKQFKPECSLQTKYPSQSFLRRLVVLLHRVEVQNIHLMTQHQLRNRRII
jgi:hypothetical protein